MSAAHSSAEQGHPVLIDAHTGLSFSHTGLTDTIAAWSKTITTGVGAAFGPKHFAVVSLPKCAAAVVACRVVDSLGCAFVMNDFNDEDEIARRVKPLFTLMRHDSPAGSGSNSTGHFIVRVDIDRCTVVEVIPPTAKSQVVPGSFEDPDILYITFSSGSTGLPKGIYGSRRCVANMYKQRSLLYPYYKNADGRPWAVAVNVFFIWECFRPLELGGTSVVIRAEDFVDPPRLREILEKYRVNEILFTPSYARLFVSGQQMGAKGAAPVWVQPPQSLRRIYLNGEVVTQALQKAVVGYGDSRAGLREPMELLNLYSISECYEVGHGNLRLSPVELSAFPGVGVEVHGDTEEIVAHTMVAHGYHNGSAADLEVFDTENWTFYHTKDRGACLLPTAADHTDVRGRQPRCEQSIWASRFKVVGRCNNNVRVKGRWAQLEAIQDIVESGLGLKHGLVTVKVDEEGQLIAYVDGAFSPESIPTVRHMLPFSEWMPDRFVPNSPTVRLPANSGKAGAEGARSPAEVLRNILYRQLGVDTSALTKPASLRELGITSLSILRLQKAIFDEAGIRMSIADLYRISDVRTFADETVTPDFLRKEVAAAIAAALPGHTDFPATSAPAADGTPAGYFVTGATGFLGGWVTHLLARRLPPTAPVFLLARRGEAETRELLARKGLQVPGGAVFLKGDLSQPDMGLTADDFARVRAATRYYVHCAAHVVFGCSYAEAKPGTVNGARSVLSLYSGARQDAELHYISTNGVYPPGYTAATGGSPCRESLADFDAYAERLREGYGWSKWVAERAIWEACATLQRPVRVYRPGNIGWSTDGAGVNPSDYQTVLLRACRALGVAPEVESWTFELTPVDTFANFILDACAASTSGAAPSTRVHNCIGRRSPLPKVFAATTGALVRFAPLEEWLAAAARFVEEADAAAKADAADAQEGTVPAASSVAAVRQAQAALEEYATLDMYLGDTNDYHSESSLCYTPSEEYIAALDC